MMSNDHNINELLSAYFDDEVTQEERAQVEQFLEEAVEARRELDHFDSLSESLKSLPGEPAPPELLPSVMRRAESEALLSISARAPVLSGVRKSWLTVFAGVVVTAASVMLVVQFLPDETPDLSRTVADNESSSPQGNAGESLAAHVADDPPAPAAAREPIDAADERWRFKHPKMDGQKESFGAPPTEGNTVAEKLADMPPNTKRGSGSGSAKIPADSRRLITQRKAAVTKPGAKKFAGDSTPSADPAPAINLDALKRARRGQVLLYFDSSGSKVTTYLVTVVDVKQGMGKLQVLLARNGIPPLQPNVRFGKQTSKLDLDAAIDKENTDKKVKSQDEQEVETDRLFAVYIETTSDRFRLALKDLLNEELFTGFSTKPDVDEEQIQVADVGNKAYRRLFDRRGNEAKSANGVRRTDALASASPTPSPAQQDAPTAQKKKPKPDAAKPSALAKAESTKKPSAFGRVEKINSKKRLAASNHLASRDLDELSSFQLQVQLAPRDANLERLRTARRKQSRSRNKTSQSVGSVKNQAFRVGKQKEAAAKDHQSAVRVLFVFREAPRQSPKP